LEINEPSKNESRPHRARVTAKIFETVTRRDIDVMRPRLECAETKTRHEIFETK